MPSTPDELFFKQGAIKEMLSGCELQIHQALFAGDVYDMLSGACISSQFTESMLPTARWT